MTSKKLVEAFEHSAVSLMVGCTLFIFSINDFNLFSPCSPHKKNMSSKYLHYKYGLYPDFFICSSAINVMLYQGAIFVPIVVPHFYSTVFFMNVNMSLFNTSSAKSIMVSVEAYLSSCFLNTNKPSSCGMLAYNPTTSIVHKIMLLGNFGYKMEPF